MNELDQLKSCCLGEVMKFKSAENKIKRARELITEISNYLVTDPPYSYFLETNTTTRQKATFSKVNEESFDI